MGTSCVDKVRSGILGWLESVRYPDEGWGRWKYHAQLVRPYALNASGLAICILNELGELDAISEAQRAEAVAYFQSCQSPDDGLFRDPLETESDLTGTHNWDQVWGQRNGAALEALYALGAEPQYPVPKAQFVDLREVDARAWSLSHDWSNPWLYGETWARAIRALLRSSTPATRAKDERILEDMFSSLESELLDPETGYPMLLGCHNQSVAMAGTFKLIFAYLDAKRPYPNAEKAIDSTLALQQGSGEFGDESNMCLNWDAVWVLRELDIQLGGSYRRDDISAAGAWLVAVLMADYLKSDGAFAFHGEHAMLAHHGIRLCHEPHPISDMLGTLMCMRCLAYSDGWRKDANLQAAR